MISGQVSELIKLNTIHTRQSWDTNPVNLVNHVNHVKVLRRSHSFIYLLTVNVIMINRIIRIHMISSQVSEWIKLNTIHARQLWVSNPVNQVNPYHLKSYAVFLFYPFSVNVIVINRIIRIHMISGQVSDLKLNTIRLIQPWVSNPVNHVNPVNHNKVLRSSRSLVLPFSRKCNNDSQDYQDSHDFGSGKWIDKVNMLIMFYFFFESQILLIQ